MGVKLGCDGKEVFKEDMRDENGNRRLETINIKEMYELLIILLAVLKNLDVTDWKIKTKK